MSNYYRSIVDPSVEVYILAIEKNAKENIDKIYRIIRSAYYDFLVHSGHKCSDMELIEEFIYETVTYDEWFDNDRRRGWRLFKDIYGDNFEKLKEDLDNFNFEMLLY